MIRFLHFLYRVFKIPMAIIIIWAYLTTFICWIKNPGLSRMELFLRTDKSFILDFEIPKEETQFSYRMNDKPRYGITTQEAVDGMAALGKALRENQTYLQEEPPK